MADVDGSEGFAVRALGRLVLIVLGVAFVAGMWDARHPDKGPLEGLGAPTHDDPVVLAHDTSAPPRLAAVRRSHHQTFDRVTFEFRDGLPRTTAPAGRASAGRRGRGHCGRPCASTRWCLRRAAGSSSASGSTAG